ncbi:DUF3703 domain-containing protein [Ottowia sp. GY511]|uniref:DUF3703 domain-containing protein n=3 Tax=Comamonadaceae TaxID=80864 RepID=A0ABW4KN66_9BURK|nr:DUF3703 domain-containing protein [Ottowia sp. GY511]TXK29498.1 DUF3703 domain-containing protein [Ottowia sp. GY511]
MTTFGTRIRPAVDAELQAAKTADNAGQAQLSFRHLERAHVLGQPWACEMCDISIAPTSGVAASGWLRPLVTCGLDVRSNADSGHLEPTDPVKRACA